MKHQEKIEKTKDEMSVIKEKYELITEHANYGTLLALTSSELLKIVTAINDPNIVKRDAPQLIDEQYFVEHYCSEFGIKAFIGYLLSLDETYLISFKALIDFMHAEFQIDSDLQTRGSEENFILKEHWFWAGGGKTSLEYCLLTDYQLDGFILDYRVGKVKISFNAAQLFSYILEEVKE